MPHIVISFASSTQYIVRVEDTVTSDEQGLHARLQEPVETDDVRVSLGNV